MGIARPMAPMETNEDSLQPKEIQNAQSSHTADQSHGPKHGQYLHLPPPHTCAFVSVAAIVCIASSFCLTIDKQVSFQLLVHVFTALTAFTCQQGKEHVFRSLVCMFAVLRCSDPLEFPEVHLPSMSETVRKILVKPQEKAKDSNRKIFSGPKKVSLTPSLYILHVFPRVRLMVCYCVSGRLRTLSIISFSAEEFYCPFHQ